jgi:hypothetical protein
MSSSEPGVASSLCIRTMTLLSLIAFSGGSRVCAQTELPQEIRLALKSNAGALSPLTITWERERRSDLPIPKVLARFQFPPTAVEFITPEKVRFMRQDGMVYTYWWRHKPQMRGSQFLLDKPLVVEEQEISFDREKYYSSSAQRPNSLTIIESADKMMAKGSKALIGACPYLDQAGFLMPQTVAELRTKQPSTHLLSYLDAGAQVIEINKEKLGDSTYVVIELAKDKQKHRFFLDPTMRYALRRRMVWSPSGWLELIIDCSDFIKLSGSDHWLPRRIHSEQYYKDDPLGKPFLVETLMVSELHNNPIPPSQFVLNYNQAGNRVADGTLPGADNFPSGRVYYEVPANPGDLDAAIQAAIEGKRFTPSWFRLSSRRARIFIVVNVVALVIVGWMLIRRYSKKKHAAFPRGPQP